MGLAGAAVFAQVLLHVATALGPACGKALRPGRRGLLVIAEFAVEARAWRCSTRSSRPEAMRGSGAADGGRRGAPICDITPAAASCSSSFS
jgi:hypothetical protein